MNRKNLEHFIVQVALGAGALAVLLAFAEGLAQVLGHSLVARMYAPSRILEIGGVLLLFAIALLLRQIRDQLAATKH